MPAGQNHSNFALNARFSSPRYDTWCKIQVLQYRAWHTYYHLGFLKPLFNNLILKSIVGPNRKRAGTSRVRIYPVPVGGLDFLRLHHKVPAPHKVRALIIKADPLESRTPGWELWGWPFFHLRTAMRALWTVLLAHGWLLLLLRIIPKSVGWYMSQVFMESIDIVVQRAQGFKDSRGQVNIKRFDFISPRNPFPQPVGRRT